MMIARAAAVTFALAVVFGGNGLDPVRLHAQAPVARPLTAADTLATRDIGEIAVAPDGSAILFTVGHANLTTNRTESSLMLLKPGQGPPTPLTITASGPNTIRWAPDGRRFAFFATYPATSQTFLYMMDLGAPFSTAYGFKQICLYDRGNSFISKAGSYLTWSPDGTKIAFAGTIEQRPPAVDPLVVTRLQYKTRTAFSDNRRTHIFIVDAAENARPKALTSGDFDNHSIDWGGDGSEIVFLSNREKDPDATLNYDIYASNVGTGAVRQITKTPGVEMDPVVSPDGRSIAYVATTRALTTIDSVAEDAHVFVVPSAGGQPRELNHTLDRRSASPAWAPDGASVLFTAADHGKSLIYRVPASGGASRPLFDRKAQASGFSIARDGTIVFGMTDPLMPRELFRLSPGAAEPAQLTMLNAELVAGWKLVAPETIPFKSFDGAEVEGWFYPAVSDVRSSDVRLKPDATGENATGGKDATGGGRSPMILNIHGGPHGGFGYSFNAGFELNASRGYATLAINPRGSSGYGQAFSDGCVNNWGGGDYQDLMAGVDDVLRTHPAVDGARLGVMGGSYGGFMTNWVITQTTRFKAAVSSASVSNLISFYATSLYQDLVHAEFNGFPWDGANYATLWKWSPIAHVSNATTPTLFVHGEQDNDVHITQAEEMYTALRRRGVQAALARYPREGHGLREPKHRLDQTTRTLEWMDRFVLGRPGSAPTSDRAR